jgi:hypothetical protein
MIRGIVGEDGTLVIDGTMMRIGVPNCNGVVFSKEAAESIVRQFDADKKPIFGPADYRKFDFGFWDIALELKKLSVENDEVVAKVTVLKTPGGKDIEAMLRKFPAEYSIVGNYMVSDFDKADGNIVREAELKSIGVLLDKDKA